ncbi:MAG: hypothetical protein ABSA84_00495 [Gammaproteobacteria bacterium]|jgi:hypothetical protein
MTENTNNSSIDDLSVSYYEEGIEITKQLDKTVLTRGAWTTIMYKYQDWDKKSQDYGPIKFTIRRYQKKNGVYKQRSKFNISSVDQAKQIIEVLTNWV